MTTKKPITCGNPHCSNLRPSFDLLCFDCRRLLNRFTARLNQQITHRMLPILAEDYLRYTLPYLCQKLGTDEKVIQNLCRSQGITIYQPTRGALSSDEIRQQDIPRLVNALTEFKSNETPRPEKRQLPIPISKPKEAGKGPFLPEKVDILPPGNWLRSRDAAEYMGLTLEQLRGLGEKRYVIYVKQKEKLYYQKEHLISIAEKVLAGKWKLSPRMDESIKKSPVARIVRDMAATRR